MLNCRRCGQALNGPIDAQHITVCPRCGKRWQLTTDHTQIQDTRLVIQPVTHASAVPQIGEKPNG